VSKASPLAEVIVSADWSVFVNIENFNGKCILLIFNDWERCGLEADTILGLFVKEMDKGQIFRWQ